jgi:hypothetical protein
MTTITRSEQTIDIQARPPEHVRPLLFQSIEQGERCHAGRAMPKTCEGEFE